MDTLTHQIDDDVRPAATPWAAGRVELHLTQTPTGADVWVRTFDFTTPNPFHRLTPDISATVRPFDLRFDWGRRTAASLQLALAVLMELEPWRDALEHVRDFQKRVIAKIRRGDHVKVLVDLRTYTIEEIQDAPAAAADVA